MTKYIKLSVPEHLCEKWDEDADKYADSRSEFIRMMVEAGRKKFKAIEEEADESNSLGETVLEIVESNEGAAPEEILDELEQEMMTELERLDNSGEINYSPKEGGYIAE